VHDDEADLRRINLRIGAAESEGDTDWLERVIAPQLGFRRVNGTYNSRSDFLASLALGPKRETEIQKIELYGDRAVVSCTVTVTSDRSVDHYHNLRLFVRDGGEWKLLGWANQR
jgi:Domain of unknown function (DUF4440)